MDSFAIFWVCYFFIGLMYCLRAERYSFVNFLFFAGFARAWLAGTFAVLFQAYREEEQILPEQEVVPEIHLDSPADPEPVYVLD